MVHETAQLNPLDHISPNAVRVSPGVVRQRKPGRRAKWTAYWAEFDAEANRSRRNKSGFSTQADGQGFLDALSAARPGESPTTLSVAAFFERWLKEVVAQKSDGTMATYQRNVDLHIAPHLGALRLSGLTTSDVNGLITGLLDGTLETKPLSITSVKFIHSIISAALNDAIRWGLVAANAAQGANPPTRKAIRKRQRAKRRTWTPTQASTFVSSLGDDRLFAAWLLDLVTGMRRGELLGLEPEALNLESATPHLMVRQQLTAASKSHSVVEPKSVDSIRRYDLPPYVVQVLRDHMAEWHMAKAESVDDGIERFRFVFCYSDGRTMSPSRLSHLFADTRDNAEVPAIRLHDLRHTMATLALNAGQPADVVAAAIGHASVGYFLETYHNVGSEDVANAVAGVADLIAPPIHALRRNAA